MTAGRPDIHRPGKLRRRRQSERRSPPSRPDHGKTAIIWKKDHARQPGKDSRARGRIAMGIVKESLHAIRADGRSVPAKVAVGPLFPIVREFVAVGIGWRRGSQQFGY